MTCWASVGFLYRKKGGTGRTVLILCSQWRSGGVCQLCFWAVQKSKILVSLTLSDHCMALNLRLIWDTSRLPGGDRELIGKSLKRNCLPLNSSGVISYYLNFTPYFFNICRFLWKLFHLLEFKSLWKVAF